MLCTLCPLWIAMMYLSIFKDLRGTTLEKPQLCWILLILKFSKFDYRNQKNHLMLTNILLDSENIFYECLVWFFLILGSMDVFQKKHQLLKFHREFEWISMFSYKERFFIYYQMSVTLNVENPLTKNHS